MRIVDALDAGVARDVAMLARRTVGVGQAAHAYTGGGVADAGRAGRVVGAARAATVGREIAHLLRRAVRHRQALDAGMRDGFAAIVAAAELHALCVRVAS